MKLFGTAVNDEFGDVEETGILIAVDEIIEEKRMRHIDTFAAEHPELIKTSCGYNRIYYKP
ncbi:MAG: hemolysin, partial [Bacteroidaceae bacterium]|nr:hemolysin [Bacteroidaceae bacterium]